MDVTPGSSSNAGTDQNTFRAAPPSPRISGDDAFHRIVEWAPTAMVMIERGGSIVLVNTQTEVLFGYPRQDLLGRPVEILVPERFRNHHGSFRTGFYNDPQPRPMGVGRELFGCRADGSEFPVEIGLNPIQTEEGVMVLASIIDITERRRNQLNLEKALQEKTVLLNEVHHRVKNNLQVISSLLNLQASHTSDSQVRNILQESQGRVKAMVLTHQLLYERKDFSRIDLGEYLARLVQLLRVAHSSGAQGVALNLAAATENVYLDLERAIPCGLLVNELVSNAFKHAFPNAAKGEIIVALKLLAPDEVEISVSDTGVGLPPGFDMENTKSLGLQLVPLFVDQLRGELRVENDGGTRFALRLSMLPRDKE
jgi:PAS domain S-box-containing protein